MSTVYVTGFNEPEGSSLALVGGKGANLGRLTSAGFPVPPGFTVTTAAYKKAITGATQKRILEIASKIDYANASQLDAKAAEIRKIIENAALPADIEKAITNSYRALGEGYVAVRSSGTAEDLAEASFAGQHDTYLDNKGIEAVLNAVRRCWASMWTARATSYRQSRGFAHADASLAVVVQTMVESEVSGVMFTANPMSGNTEETVINASWGLGEAIVSGIVTPDQFIVLPEREFIREKVIGSKEKQCVRNPKTKQGTVTQPVDAAKQGVATLSDEQILELAELGASVMRYYGHFPQDTEWGFAGGRFYLLQSRPITGVTFSWDNEVEVNYTRRIVDHDDYVWSRSWADEQWCGAIAPLTFSYRTRMFTLANQRCASLWGEPRLTDTKMFKYHKAVAYYNTEIDRLLIEATCLTAFRPTQLQNIPPQQRDAVVAAPYSVMDYLKLLARIRGSGGSDTGLYSWFDDMRKFFADTEAQANGMTREQLTQLSDRKLKKLIDEIIELEISFTTRYWSNYYTYARDANLGFALLIASWYDGENKSAHAQLMTGVDVRNATGMENLEFWSLTMDIRNSKRLTKLFEANEGAKFFTALQGSEEGRAFAAKYQTFLSRHGHRGHADRDMFYSRRADDPMIDYRLFKALLASGDTTDPEQHEAHLAKRRAEVADDVIANLRRKPLGALRAEAFKLLYDYVQRFMVIRDDERYWIDRSTYSLKRAVEELGRRMVARGLIGESSDVHFLGRDELFDVFDGRYQGVDFHAKIAGRRYNFEKYRVKEAVLPLYMSRDRALHLEAEADIKDGMIAATATSGGKITGVARVVKTVEGIGNVGKGEILITNSTDPGWTPVFMVITGIVLETGGMLAHGSMLAREYGLPAVQLPGAMRLIPDGATITVDGDRGTIQIHEEA